jgi:hypothetical protein
MGKRSKRPPVPANLDDFVDPLMDDVKKGVDSLLRSKPETLRSKPETTEPEARGAPGTGRASPDCQVTIIDLHTIGPTGPQTVFRMHEDALVLRIEIHADGSFASSETYFDANFQLLEYATNVVAQDFWCRGLPLRHGTELSISQGNNQGPEMADNTPPAAWGLRPGLYVFRALIEIPALSVFCQSDSSVLFRVR